MSVATYRLRDPDKPAMGLIVLRVDETIETEFRQMIPPDAARLYVSRLPSGDDLTPESIAAMEDALGGAAALLPPAVAFDVVAYACTSGTAHIGANSVTRTVSQAVKTRAVTNPLTAAIARLTELGAQRVGIVSPYTPEVSQPLITEFDAAGLAVAETLSFDERQEARVARIDPASIAEAARALASRGKPDAIFLSCTNLQTTEILDNLTEELGLPVLSSNQVLAWHMQQLARKRGPAEPSQTPKPAPKGTAQA